MKHPFCPNQNKKHKFSSLLKCKSNKYINNKCKTKMYLFFLFCAWIWIWFVPCRILCFMAQASVIHNQRVIETKNEYSTFIVLSEFLNMFKTTFMFCSIFLIRNKSVCFKQWMIKLAICILFAIDICKETKWALPIPV